MCRLYYIDIIKHIALQKIVRNYSGIVHPGDLAPVVVYINKQYTSKMMNWGYLLNDKMIYNVRSETILEKVFFQSVYTQRCLVPVSGFYEWTKHDQQVCYELDKPFYLAGIYQKGRFCIVTTKANTYVKKIHHRMPLVLLGDDIQKWLSPEFQDVLKVKDYHFHLQLL